MGTEQKVAVVTGASQGIGAGLVKAFHDRSYRVVANSRSIKPASDEDILTVAGDIADPATAKQMIAEGLERFGRIDTLVNNAGIFIAKRFTNYTEAEFAAVVSTNLAGFFHVTQRAIEAMERQGSGHIVNITTSLVNHANSSVPSVLASLTNGGLDSATKSLAIEYAKRGIRVNAVAPGIIKTPMHAPEDYEALGKLHPVGRMGEISDIVGAVLYLETAGFVTGEILLSTAARALATNSSQSSADHEPARKGAAPSGREGASRSLYGPLGVNSRPGGAGSGTNPEQLSPGWSACFISVMQLVAGRRKIALPADVAVDAKVDLGRAGDAYELAVRLDISLPGVERDAAERLPSG